MNFQIIRSSFATLAIVAVLATASSASAQGIDHAGVRPLPNPGISTEKAQAGSQPNTKPAQTPPQTAPQTAPVTPSTTSDLVSIKADGADVHNALKSLFTQARKNYVIEPGVYFALYLSLDGVEFDEALGIICHLAKLKVDTRDGIYYVSPDHGQKPETKPVETKPAETKPNTTKPVADSKPPTVAVSTGTTPTPHVAPKLTPYVLRQRRVNVHFSKTDIRSVIAELGKQSNVPISIDKAVPNYKLDVVLHKASLYYALTRITKAAGLTFAIENGGVIVAAKQAPKTAPKRLAANP